jgi:DNA-binding transcriptional regulator YdaS (Cro superfamily)
LTYTYVIANNSRMELKNWCDEERGRQAWLAREVGVSLPTMTRWVNGQDPIPEHRARQIERATGGVVTMEDMLPDLASEFAYMRTRPSPEMQGQVVLTAGMALGYNGLQSVPSVNAAVKAD